MSTTTSLGSRPILVCGPRYHLLWLPLPGDPPGHLSCHHAYTHEGVDADGMAVVTLFPPRWEPGDEVYTVRRDAGGIVTCLCSTYWREGECSHAGAVLETGLI